MNFVTLFKNLFDNSAYAVNVLTITPMATAYKSSKAQQWLPRDENFYSLLSQRLGYNTLQEFVSNPAFAEQENREVEILIAYEGKHNQTIKSVIRQITLEDEKFIIIESTLPSISNLQILIQSDVKNVIQQIIDLVPEPIFLKDNQRRFLLVNKSFLAYHNATVQQIIGSTDEDIKKNPEEYRQFIEDDIRVINSGEALYVKRETYTNFKGRLVSLKTTKIPFYWMLNEKPGIIGIAIDITQKLAFRKKLKSNRKMQRQIVDLVPHMIYLKDHEGKFSFINKEFIKRSGLLEKEILGKTVFEIYPEEQANRYHQEDLMVIKNLQEVVIEKEFGPMYEGGISIFTTIKKPYFTYDSSNVGVLSICMDLTERLRSKEMLDQQKIILNEIINLLPQEIYLKDEDGKMILANKACADDLQLPQESLIGKTDFDFFTKESAQSFYDLEQEILTDGQKRHIAEEISIDKNNVTRIKSVLKMPFYLSDRRKNGILGMNIDITDAKRAEKNLRDSELRYKTLMEQASDGIYLSDGEGNIIAANQKAAELFGYSEEEFKKINIKGIISPDLEIVKGLAVPYKADKQSLILEKKFHKKDGSTFTAELSVKLLDDGKHQAILRDVTERKKMEKILVDNERKFRLLIENSSDLIIIVSKNFIIKFLSPSVSRLLGYSEIKLIGTSILEILLEKDIELASKLFSKILKNNEPIVGEELRIKNTKGNYLLFETVAVNMLDDDNINGIIINCHDITQRKNTENELINTNFELDSFVYKASHDLKAPLRSVMGLIKLARLEVTDANMEVYFDMMSKSVTSLDTFIKDLTQFSRNSRMEMEPVEIDFEEIIQESLGNLKFVERADEITVNLRLELTTKFYSDRTRIATIINNLLSNAFKYHRFDGNIPYLNISVHSDCDEAVIIVEDNGMGIEKIHLDYIFDMFYRASEASYGSGLGLYILKSAITKIKGTVKVESELGQGTIFTIELPNFLNKSEL